MDENEQDDEITLESAPAPSVTEAGSEDDEGDVEPAPASGTVHLPRAEFDEIYLAVVHAHNGVKHIPEGMARVDRTTLARAVEILNAHANEG